MNIHDLTLARDLKQASATATPSKTAQLQRKKTEKGLAAELLANANDFAAELERMSQNGKIIPECGLPTPDSSSPHATSTTTRFAGSAPLQSKEPQRVQQPLHSPKGQQELNELLQLMQMAGNAPNHTPSTAALQQAIQLVPTKK